MNGLWVLTAVCALTDMGVFHHKACKKQHKVCKNIAKCLVFKNDCGKDKKCKVKALLSNLFPPPGNRKASVSTSCSGLTLAHARLRHCWQGRLVLKAEHTLLTLPERAVLPLLRPEETRSCPVASPWMQHCSQAVCTCC